MTTAISVHVAHRGETRNVEAIGKADQGWPETPMNKGDLAAKEAAGEHLWGGT